MKLTQKRRKRRRKPSGSHQPEAKKQTPISSYIPLAATLLILQAILQASALQLPLAPQRQVPQDTIVLENGSTTFVSTLEEYLTLVPPVEERVAESNKSLKTNGSSELEREDFRRLPESILNFESGSADRGSNSSLQSSSSSSPAPQAMASKPEEQQHPKGEQERNEHHAHAGHGQQAGNATNKPIPQHWQVKSLLNVTQDYPLAYSQIICGYIWPLMAAITLFTNLMIVFVLTQKDMRTPTNVVLTAIAIADIIPIVVPVPWFVYLFAMGNEREVLYPPVACYFYQHSTRSVSEIFYFLSTWLNVLLAVQDYLTACRPKLAKRWCQIKVVVYEIILLTLLAFLLNLPQALKLVFKPVKFYYNGQLTWGCKALQARWFKEFVGEYVALYDDVFTALIVVFVDGGPAIALITLSYLLIRQLQRQRIKGHLLMEQARTASKRRLERNRQQEYESSARVMIFVLLAFLAVKIPFATTYTLMIIQSRFEIHFVENLVDFQKAITITDLVFVLSYPINFTIFCCCSKKFRHKCVQLFGEFNQNTRSARKSLVGSLRFSGSFRQSECSIMSEVSRSCKMMEQERRRKASLASNKMHEQQQQQEPLFASNRSLATMPDTPGSRNSIQTITEESEQAQSSPSLEDSNGYVRTGVVAAGSGQGLEAARAAGQRLPQPLDLKKFGDGTLCLECILQYEQIRRLSSMSDSLSSWPIPPPPPPPQSTSYMAGKHLPHIITTRCESIVEPGSPAEQPRQSQGSIFSADTFGFASTSQLNYLSSGLNLNSPPESHLLKPEASQFREIEPKDESRRAKNIDEATLKLMRTISNANASARGNSDPGTSLALLNTFRMDNLARRASGTSIDKERRLPAEEAESEEGEQQQAGGGSNFRARGALQAELSAARQTLEPSALLETQRKLLSKSDSKLTSLPNATGLLADVMISTLFGPEASEAAQRADSNRKKRRGRRFFGCGAHSEQPIHISPAKRQQRDSHTDEPGQQEHPGRTG